MSEKLNGIIVFSSFYIIGIIAFFIHAVPVTALLLLVLTIIFLYKNRISNLSAVICYLAFALALTNCHFQIKNFDALTQFIPSEAALSGTVETIPTTNNSSGTKFYLKVDSGVFDKKSVQNLNARTIVTIYDTPENIAKIKIADKIQVKGYLRSPLRAKNPNQFDYANYLKNHQTFSTFYVKSNDWKILSGADTFFGKALQRLHCVRIKILEQEKKYIKSPNIEVLGGIVFGDDAINPPEFIKTSFINSGLLHILAASGMNVSIIFGIWYFIGTRLRLNYRLVILTGAVLVGFYTLMTGMGPSVLRAALMIEFVLLGKIINRQADSIALIFLVAFLMLLYNPTMINDVGFQLSFVVTFALIYSIPPILEKIENKILSFTVGFILVPFIAQLWAAPIQMFYFNTFATYSIPANLVIAPFIMVISFGGFICSILAMIPFEQFTDKICMIFSSFLNPIVTILINISDFFSNLPHSLITTIHPHAPQIFIYLGILLLIVQFIKSAYKNKKFLILSVILTLILALSFLKPVSNDCEILVFDVGNADSFLIKSPQNKYILIDTAHGTHKNSKSNFSQANAIIGKYLKDNGITQLDYLIITHFDSDHSGGATDIIKTVTVKNLVLNKYKDDSQTTKNIFNFIKEKNINYFNAKNKGRLINEENFTLTTFTADFSDNKNDNDNSIVTLVSYKDFDVLFMGDGNIRTFDKIKKDLNKDKIEIIKTGHHGARNTVSTKMLKAIKPDTAIISTGINNYGHPSKETLKILSKNKITIYRTDTHNAIKITSDGKKYIIYKYNTKKRKFEKDVELPILSSGNK